MTPGSNHMQRTFIDSGSKIDLNKKSIIRFYINNGSSTIAELTKGLDLSIPTTTKLVGELIDEGFVQDFGKQETEGGRRPNLYGLNPGSGYFIGVDVKKFRVNIALINFKGETLKYKDNIPFLLENTRDALNQLCDIIRHFLSEWADVSEKILCVGVNVSGRVNPESGYSYSYFYFEEKPLSELIAERVGMRCFIDNDSRAMAYGEYMCGVAKGEKSMIFVNVGWGLGVGIVIDGKPYYGKSGFSGEFGHIYAFNNEIICHCGKKGCLETEASGLAIHRMMLERVKGGTNTILQEKIESDKPLLLEDIIEAALEEDVLAIEIIEEAGNKLGRAISGLINLFNPELLVIGGTVSLTGDYIFLPIKSAVKKYSLNLVNKDTEIKLSRLGDKAGAIGAGLFARERILGIY
ncbi:MAG: ROK family transcriptional regulator [Prolixibacteraceae bacterium]